MRYFPVALVYPELRRAASRRAPPFHQPSPGAQKLVHYFRHKDQPHSLRLRFR
jgi:hypothetical protein